MALYKVIGNYYSNVLDVINASYIKSNRNFDEAYNKLDQKKLTLLLAETVVRMEGLKTSEIGYWKMMNSQYKMYMAIFIIVIVLVAAAFAWFGWLAAKELKDNFAIIKMIVVYVIIYLIIFIPLFMLVYNVSKLQKQANIQMKKIREEFDKTFINFLLKGDKTSVLHPTLLYIGYLANKNKGAYNKIKDTYFNNTKKKTAKGAEPIDPGYLSLVNRMTDTNFTLEIKNGLLATDIKDSMKQFFDNGRGYYSLKKLIVSQSNVYMMRETRRIVNYYYFLVLKKSTEQNIELSEQNKLSTIKSLIIDPTVKITLKVLQRNTQTYLEFIDQIATDLVPYNIDLVKQKSYITDEITKATPDMTSKDADFLNEFINRLNKTVFIKQQTSLKKLVGITDETRYLEPADFINNIYDMTFVDFHQGFEIQFLKDIVDDFYTKITESQSYKNGNNADNIYYERTKSLDVYEKFMVLLFLLIALAFMYYCFTFVKDEFVEIGEYRREQMKQIDTISDDDIKVKRSNILAKEYAKLFTNWLIKFLIPLAAMIFVIALIYSFYVKKRDTFRYNKDMIESNTSEFKSSIHKLEEKLVYLNQTIPSNEKISKITNISTFTDDDKFEIFAHIKNVVDKFEKCNFIMEAGNLQLPFPYTEIVMDVFMILVLVAALLYIFAKLEPISKISSIKSYNMMAEKAKSGINDKEFNDKIDINENCHDEDMDSIIYTLKIIVFIFILVFLLFYSTKLLSSSSEFKAGLYNSNYFEESRCYD